MNYGKSQLHSQIFIYILTIFLVSFIIIYGYKSIQNFQQRAEKVSCLKFQNDLKNAVQSIAADFGTVRKKELGMCGGYRLVCFVESFEGIENRNAPAVEPSMELDPIIADSILSSSSKNVFLVRDIADQSFYVGNISVPKDVLCVSAQNSRIVLELEGRGSHVSIKKWA